MNINSTLAGVMNFDEFEDTLSGAHNVTGIVKEWLRSLPFPLIPEAAFAEFHGINGTHFIVVSGVVDLF